MSDEKVCKCGKGYVSKHDGKCGHCRTKKEKKALDDAFRKQQKALDYFFGKD